MINFKQAQRFGAEQHFTYGVEVSLAVGMGIEQGDSALLRFTYSKKGMLFAACLKLLIPLIVIFPAIMAFQLFAGDVAQPDKAYPHIARRILPAGLRGLMFATLLGLAKPGVVTQSATARTMRKRKGRSLPSNCFMRRSWDRRARGRRRGP